MALRPDASELDWDLTLCSGEIIKRQETEEDSVKVSRVEVLLFGAKIRL